ncbi:MAG: chromosome partitioning protein ParA [Spirochaetes bacterium GWF1_31_7]|nr:MAG: chromosome partitioning protein ParA [Spirochaetes bacterium GWE1_32_154]OHD48532.1 MAG: chromosome partitioning protein ParA [Spirochaetes bacterium GWE2_31_10]OHD51447.1 MAG: chromosome partitioning protein ParA [Spirochaetes bacterium GWF1_31_7]OHD80007.1 MAG: chromosome partitioning protein ParA [Spirochaetes bacterium RIFOXYB1_FULL_32_8]HBD93338.1 chromosome partitioning protein ParA [Spirochaetia bacterium]
MKNRVITIANQKGGVGKTTTSINLSVCLALLGKKVLIIDFDPQGNCSSGLGIPKDKNTIYEILLSGKNVDECIIKSQIENCDVIPANINLSGATVELANVENCNFYLKKITDQLKTRYDYIFIDCPPSLGVLTLNGLTASDAVLIPIQTEFFALEGLTQLIHTINIVKKDLNPRLQIEGVVLTMLDKRTHLTDDVTKNVIGYFGKKVYKTMIPRNIRIAEAPSFGLPVVIHDVMSTGAKAYQQLAKEFIDGEE